MKDRSLGISLIVMFGLSGLVVIALGWFLPTLQSDRFTATFAGLVGIAIAAVRALTLRQPNNSKRVPVENES